MIHGHRLLVALAVLVGLPVAAGAVLFAEDFDDGSADADIAMRTSLTLAAAGVDVVNWSMDERQKLRDLAIAVWRDWSERSPMAARAYEAQTGFLRSIASRPPIGTSWIAWLPR